MAIDLRFRLRLNVIGMDENRGRERERERMQWGMKVTGEQLVRNVRRKR